MGFRRWMVVVGLVVVAVVGTGCPHRYTWSSDAGRRCFNSCKRGRYQCNAGCFGSLICGASCERDERDCYGSCPDVTEVH
jgi:hypothetical protein